ncbi:MAG: hypothetical protein U0L86_00680, partial [Alistipes finegoldii]|nr:hypothetical protein [Alistipes finegoldii]
STCCWNPTCPVSIWNSRRTTKLAVYVNGNLLDNAVKRQDNPALPQRIEGIPLEKGWNHVLLKVGQLWGGWNGRFRFIATDPAYMRQLESVIMQ